MIPKPSTNGQIAAFSVVFGDVASRQRTRRVTPVCLRACARSRAETHELDIARGDMAWESNPMSARTGFSSSLIGSEVPAEMERA